MWLVVRINQRDFTNKRVYADSSRKARRLARRKPKSKQVRTIPRNYVVAGRRYRDGEWEYLMKNPDLVKASDGQSSESCYCPKPRCTWLIIHSISPCPHCVGEQAWIHSSKGAWWSVSPAPWQPPGLLTPSPLALPRNRSSWARRFRPYHRARWMWSSLDRRWATVLEMGTGKIEYYYFVLQHRREKDNGNIIVLKRKRLTLHAPSFHCIASKQLIDYLLPATREKVRSADELKETLTTVLIWLCHEQNREEYTMLFWVLYQKVSTGDILWQVLTEKFLDGWQPTICETWV